MAHRGPDAQGSYQDRIGRVCLAHRRLAVIDLSDEARQPMATPDGRYTLVFNGEIYNFLELRTRLERQGVEFRTRSDTEVLLRLLQRGGLQSITDLRGMFAFALWDAAREELLLVRDRLGKKPLFYALEDGCLYFASTFRALRDTSGVHGGMDAAAVDTFLDLGYIPAPATIDAGISKLQAGSLALVSARGVETRCYSEPAGELEPFRGDDDAALDHLDELVNTATELRLRSDVPLGVFLSGGLDSSLVAAVAARQAPGTLATFCIAFDESGYDESPYAAAIARHLGTEHHTFRVRPDLISLLPDVVRHFGEPFADATALATWHLAQQTRPHVTVALGGDGGDEGFAGYNWYRTAARLQRLHHVARPIAAWQLPRGHAPRALARLRRGMNLLSLDEASRFAALRSFVSAEEADPLYAGELADVRREGNDGGRAHLRRIFASSTGSALRRMRVVDVRTYLADCLLPKVDVPTMAFGLEARAPLLDQEVLRFGLSLPDHLLVHKGRGKRILHRLVNRYLPGGLFERPKQGFSVPMERWFSTCLRDSMRSLTRDSALLDTGWFRPEGLDSLVGQHLSGHRDHSQRLYSLLVLNEWVRQN